MVKVAQVNLVFTILILFLLLSIIFVVINYYLKLKGTLSKVVDTFKSIIPKLEHHEYKKITYPHWGVQHYSPNFNLDTAILLANFGLSAYNLAGGYDPRLPNHIEFIRRIGGNGYLFKKDKEHILVYRGTLYKEDLWTDFDVSQRPLPHPGERKALVHRGFYDLWYKSRNDLRELIDELTDEFPLYITGHSMGTATATLSALYLAPRIKSPIVLYNFAAPHLGDGELMGLLQQTLPNNYSIQNSQDIIPYLPPNNCATLSHTYLYDNYPNVIHLDLQTNSMVDNHHLTSYLYALDQSSEKPSSVIWNRPIKRAVELVV